MQAGRLIGAAWLQLVRLRILISFCFWLSRRRLCSSSSWRAACAPGQPKRRRRWHRERGKTFRSRVMKIYCLSLSYACILHSASVASSRAPAPKWPSRRTTSSAPPHPWRCKGRSELNAQHEVETLAAPTFSLPPPSWQCSSLSHAANARATRMGRETRELILISWSARRRART